MQKKNFLRLAIILVALLGSLAALRSSPSASEKSTCKASTNRCPQQKKVDRGSHPGGMIWDNLTSQFISILSPY